MLSEDEEERLDGMISLAENDRNKGLDHGGEFTLDAVLWLATKLKETNNELSQVHAELYKTNKEFANYVEAHE
jgi:hypothetical protein